MKSGKSGSLAQYHFGSAECKYFKALQAQPNKPFQSQNVMVRFKLWQGDIVPCKGLSSLALGHHGIRLSYALESPKVSKPPWA